MKKLTKSEKIKSINKNKEYKRQWAIKNKEKVKENLKNYYIKNRENILIKCKEYSKKNKETIRKQRKEYRKNNSEKIKTKKNNYYQKNKESIRQKHKKYYLNNKDHIKKATSLYRKTQYQKNLKFKISSVIRKRLWNALHSKNSKKTAKSLELVGCSIDELKIHLENQFKNGMSWDNYGYYGWHIDHIKPCASFDLTNPEEQRKCFHYTNLQPLWANDNFKKSNKTISNSENFTKIEPNYLES